MSRDSGQRSIDQHTAAQNHSKTPPDQRPEGEVAEPYSTARVAERFDAAPVASPSSSASTTESRLELYGIVKRGIDSAFERVRKGDAEGDIDAKLHRLLFEAHVALSQLAAGEAARDA